MTKSNQEASTSALVVRYVHIAHKNYTTTFIYMFHYRLNPLKYLIVLSVCSGLGTLSPGETDSGIDFLSTFITMVKFQHDCPPAFHLSLLLLHLWVLAFICMYINLSIDWSAINMMVDFTVILIGSI